MNTQDNIEIRLNKNIPTGNRRIGIKVISSIETNLRQYPFKIHLKGANQI